MTSKPQKESIVSKMGMKLGVSKTDMELDKLRKENAHLRKKLDELSHRQGKLTHTEKSKLLERIVSLETLKEKNTQQLSAKDQELSSLRQQMTAASGGIVASLQSQLDQKNLEAQEREKQLQTLLEEMRSVKNKFAEVSARCQDLEKRSVKGNPDSQSPNRDGQTVSGNPSAVQEQLRDALEKNQQWLVYDQQREAYVKAVLARTFELEQQLNQANQALQQQNKEGNSEEEKCAQMQQYYDKLLLTARKDLEAQKEQVAQVQGELAELRKRYEDKCGEAEEVAEQLQAERLRSHRSTKEGVRRSEDLEQLKAQLDEEKRRSAELLMQVNMLQKSLLHEHEEQKRIAVLEHQIQMSARDFENEKLDRQTLQQQLHKVLKELRKARDQITRLESVSQKQQPFSSEPNPYSGLGMEKLSIEDLAAAHRSPARIPGLLDESFLECPRCRAQYPTSQHRELLAHIDYCLT
ncbi:centrosomal protein of 55 kDa-like [Scleropages formosus]|uniref:Centrosomal protein of 55 kDa n=1 Tax=Scleropages formosus TaxID=113540 RepID=A0A0P7Z2J7_SCLFO|nr:centrosomal protein of 55 kDa [Scleropages formosus]KPP74755.1 centrosomal protein of 55 kDa-like [Scleropages formosus]